MLILVSGGSASGKSEFAEGLVTSSGLENRIYLATMQVWDGESVRRVERHRQMRTGKGFATVECPTGLADVALPSGCAVLLEDLSNLCANEYFSPGGKEGVLDRVLAGIRRLRDTAALTVVVGNDLFGDGLDYDGDTRTYLLALADLHRRLAAEADGVYEVVCGIPICHRKEGGA